MSVVTVYVVFAVAIIIRYGWLASLAVRGHDPISDEPETPAEQRRA